MKLTRKTRWVIIIIVLLFITGWLFIRYDNKAFLRYGVLHIDKFPNSLKVLHDDMAGWNDQQYEYYILVNPNEFEKLLAGRRYIKQPGKEGIIVNAPDSFPARKCYSSGNLKNGLVNIFVNSNNSIAYIVYDIE